MARKRNKLLSLRSQPKQPKKCKGCVWGKWDGVKQFCLRPCVKEEKPS